MTDTAYPLNAVAGAPAYTGRMTRQALSALIGGATSARPLGATSGVRLGTPTTTTVTATSTAWAVGAHSGILDVETSTAAGPYLYATEGGATGTVTPADGTNPRVDIVWVQLSDNAEDLSGAVGVTFGYTAGTPAATPSAPAGPVRSLILANINVPKSGTGSPSVVWAAPYATASGGTFVVGKAVITSSQSVTGASATDVTGLSVTAPIAASRRLRLAFEVDTHGSGAADVFAFQALDGATVLRVWTSPANSSLIADATYSASGFVIVEGLAAGLHTFKLQIQHVVGAGTCWVAASSTAPATLVVEDLGSV